MIGSSNSQNPTDMLFRLSDCSGFVNATGGFHGYREFNNLSNVLDQHLGQRLCDVPSTSSMLLGNTPSTQLPNASCSSKNISLNTSGTLSSAFGSQTLSEWKILFLVLVLIMITFTFVGNTFVILSIRLERRLQTPTNYLTLSLAVTDLLVSVLVMPLSVINVVSHDTILIPVVCHIWIILDVNLCSVSIFHLLVIAVDRYRSVTNINYRCKRSSRKIFGMVSLCWSVGLVICVPLVFGVADPKYDPSITGKCLIDQSVFYTLFSTIFAFYIPAIAMVTIYYKIYRIAKSSIRKTYFKKLLKTGEKAIRRSSAPECLNSCKRRHRTSFANFRYHFGRSRASLDSSGSCLSNSSVSVQSPRRISGSSQHSVDFPQIHYGRCNSRTSLDSSQIHRSSISSNSRRSAVTATGCDTDSGYTECQFSLNGSQHEKCTFDNQQPDTRDKGHKSVCLSVSLENQREKFTWFRASVNNRHEKFVCSSGSSGNHQEMVGCSRTSFNKRQVDTVHSRASIDGRCVSFSDSNFVQRRKSCIEPKVEIGCGRISRNPDQAINVIADCPTLSEVTETDLSGQSGIQIFTIGNDENFEEKSTRFSGRPGNILNLAEEKRKHETKRERRAARTLGIITGTFIICWLPFFIVALISPLLENSDVTIPESVQTFVLWLGYFNCLVNPVIYTVFNPEFRKAFKKLTYCLYCTKHRIH
ncbi:5-hydroxytryptamine receptor 2A-like [Ylistrum balloti]|uniref:5-hydroxytryptamine receptor 2A-like n=1 Tax=Ylistrum balloti TaxID=509963 RepID=UPI0029058365|nr:5-hydroxytryptamine receptor 2A-like [Ylistrum balloti]